MAAQQRKALAERRRIMRQKSLLRGTIPFNNRRSVLDCVIRDITPFGARLMFSDTVTLPDTFDLSIPQKEQTLRSHIIWRLNNEVGVTFVQHEPGMLPADADLLDRIHRLETEVATLKRILRHIKADGVHEFEPD